MVAICRSSESAVQDFLVPPPGGLIFACNGSRSPLTTASGKAQTPDIRWKVDRQLCDGRGWIADADRANLSG